ncbi:MAG: VOC family protein [Ilumatobacter sp.]|uniref:VOC family protein n=1 Tax=Ilumatobacter sp. TaxID=1967498 RepID=UPI003298B0DF
MGAQFDLVTLDSPSPDDLGRFWAAALDLVEVQREDGDRWIVLATESGVRRIGIQRGATRVGSVHLDLSCDLADFDDETRRLIELGATMIREPRREDYGSIVNLADPDGNPFDLCAYR